MKATLYDALGILPTSSDEEVRAALRGLIRKYYAKTRDGQGNVEEALRFINHASRILSDEERRQRYDEELSRSTDDDGDVPSRQLPAHAAIADDADSELGAATRPEDDLAADPLDSVLSDEADVPATHHPGLTERVASFGRSRLLTYGVCGLFGAFIAAAIVFVTPPDLVVVARSVLASLAVALLLLGAVYGIVHGATYLRRRRGTGTRSALVPQTDLAILNWRRQRSVFLGTNQPQEDASWIFQLRMAELERAKSGRTSEPRPWHRLAARMFDYAIFGLLLALLLSQLRSLGVIPEATAYWLAHPLIAPTLITLAFVPIEALLVTSVGTTPGKWLFGVYLQFSISDAYARRDTRAQLLRALSRSIRVWVEGVGCGFPLLAPVVIAIAHERLALHQETDWDFACDCLVTQGPAGVVNTITGVCGLAAMVWLYGVAWQQPMANAVAWAKSSITSAMPSGDSLKGRFAQTGGDLQRYIPALPAGGVGDMLRMPRIVGSAVGTQTVTSDTASQGPSDAEFTSMMAARRARIELLKSEGPRMLRAGNARRAVDLCRAWVDLDLANADAWRCLGRAQQAAGDHQEALNSFRKARQHNPSDRSIDADIAKAERAIVAGFLNRYER